MKITEFNRTTLAVLRTEIQNALNEVAKKHGLTALEMKNISFQASSFSTKIEGRTGNKMEDPLFVGRQKFALRSLGLPENAIGQQFESISGRRFQIERIDTKKHKMPVIAFEVIGGQVTTKSFKFPVNAVKKYLETHGA